MFRTLWSALACTCLVYAQEDVVSREVGVQVDEPVRTDVVSREVSVQVREPARVDVISREVGVYVTLPDLVASVPIIRTPGVRQGAFLQLQWTVTNTGGEVPAVNLGWVDEVWLSADLAAGNADDVLLASVPWLTGIGSGGSVYRPVQTLWIPPTVAQGDYYVYVHADAQNLIEEESSETDNLAFSTDTFAIGPPGAFTDPNMIAAGDGRLEGFDVTVHDGTLIVDGPHRFASLELRNGGVLTHSAASEGGLELEIASDLVVDATSAIDASGMGYPAGEGPGYLDAWSSASHGGQGTWTDASASVSELVRPAFCYGSLEQPRALGSGGSHGAGGGAIAILVTETLQLDGAIRADGMPRSAPGGAGGGSGGSVWVDAGTVIGAGRVSADGGAQAGGGGRVHLVATTAAGFQGALTAHGAAGPKNGGAGTVVFEELTTGSRNLEVRNYAAGLQIAGLQREWGGTELPADLDFDFVYLDDGAKVFAPRASFGLRMHVRGDLVVGAGAVLWANGDDFLDGADGGAGGFVVGEGPGTANAAGVAGAGASHGGQGGAKFNDPPIAVYDNDQAPQLPGSSPGAPASRAGGAIVVAVDGDLVMDGIADADAGTGSSGGSILLLAETITGSGALTANGGDSDDDPAGCGSVGPGGGGRIALHARQANGLLGFAGTTAASAGAYAIATNLTACNGGLAQPGTVVSVEPSPLVIDELFGIDGTEDFESLLPTARPDRVPADLSGDWGNAGAWAFVPTYASFAAEEDLRIVPSPDGSGGQALKLGTTGASSTGEVYVSGQWREPAAYRAARELTVEARIWLDPSVPDGGIFAVGHGQGQAPDLGAAVPAPVADLGPVIEWLPDTRLVARLPFGLPSQTLRTTTPEGVWQRVRMEIDLERWTYDLFWSDGGDWQWIGVLPFVSELRFVDRFVLGVPRSVAAGACFDDLSVRVPATGAVPFGSNCGAPPLVLTTAGSSNVVLGTAIRASLRNIPTGLAFLQIGFSNTTWGQVPLPYDLAALGAPGCVLLQSGDAPAVPAIESSGSVASFSVPLPPLAGFFDAPVYLQAWAPAPGANPANVIWSNGIDVRSRAPATGPSLPSVPRNTRSIWSVLTDIVEDFQTSNPNQEPPPPPPGPFCAPTKRRQWRANLDWSNPDLQARLKRRFIRRATRAVKNEYLDAVCAGDQRRAEQRVLDWLGLR